jgi:hypothetical protein
LGRKAKFPPGQLGDDESTKKRFARGRLNNMFVCETDIIDVTGPDTEQEQATLGRVRMAPEAFPN